MPPRLRYFVYFLDFEMYSASRGPLCDSAAPCLSYFIINQLCAFAVLSVIKRILYCSQSLWMGLIKMATQRQTLCNVNASAIGVT